MACSDRSGRAASVAPWPALPASRQKAPECEEQRRFANRASRRCGGSPAHCLPSATHPYESPVAGGLRQPQPAALTVQWVNEQPTKIFYPEPGKKIFAFCPGQVRQAVAVMPPCGEGSQTGEVHTTGNTAAGSRETSKPRLPKLNG